MNELETLLDKYFDDHNIHYYHPVDAIANDHYIRWEYYKHQRECILLSIGSNDGETPINIFRDAVGLEQIINLIINGS
jgi:hypothetical protein